MVALGDLGDYKLVGNQLIRWQDFAVQSDVFDPRHEKNDFNDKCHFLLLLGPSRTKKRN